MEKSKKRKKIVLIGLFSLMFLIMGLTTSQQQVRSLAPEDSLVPLDSSFTYQGFLEMGGSPVDGSCNFRFTLYNASTNGNTIGSTITKTLTVDRGVFSTDLNFGNAFYFDERWLSIAVRCPAGSGAYTTLSPRSKIVAAPLANAMPNVAIDPSSGHIGINNGSFPYAYWLDVNGDIRSKDSIHVTTTAGGVRTSLDYNSNGGTVAVKTGSGVTRAEMGVTSYGAGQFTLDNASGSERLNLSVLNGGEGYIGLDGPNGNRNIQLTSLSGNSNHGYVSVHNSSGATRAGLYVDTTGSGVTQLLGANGNGNISLNYLNGYPNNGYISVRNSSGTNRAGMYVNASQTGQIFTIGPNGNANTALSNSSAGDNSGWLGVYDASGNVQSSMYVNSSGQGVLFADVKNFMVENPNDSETDIWYASLEGPEAAAYIRGTAELINGEAIITFPDHFLAIATEAGMTVQVTPLSAESLGLAVVEKRLDGVVVRELQNGTGTYEFDFTVTAVRKGYENYEVVRPNLESQPAQLQFENVLDSAEEGNE